MAELPPPLRDEVEVALSGLGGPTRITSSTPVSGGCINHGARLGTTGGVSYFIKWNAEGPPSMFAAEAHGLGALADACPLRVPKPVARGGGEGVPGWLLLEYVEPGRPGVGYDEALGRGLAALHSAPRDGGFGWAGDNWIGSLPQANTSSSSWTAFWRDERLVPQLEAARGSGHLRGPSGQVMDRLLELLPTAMADLEHASPALLHGDLWSGNAYADESGAPVIIDPAVYAGHGEVDLAMTELFGGFGPRFYAAYDEVLSITDAYDEYRRDLYQLYYLLVHVNLFGAGYVSGTLGAASRVVSALA